MSDEALPVLILAPRRDGELVERVLVAQGQACARIASGEALLARLDERCGAVLLAEETLSDRFAADLAAALARQPPWSDLPILLVAQHDLQRTRVRGLEILGNVSVLMRPMAVDALVTSVASALRARRRQHQVRDLLHAEQEQARRKDDFLAMLAHELRNPLAPVRFAAQVLETAQLGHDQMRATAALIGRQVTHMARIIDDLLDVSRLDRGLIRLECTTLDLAQLAHRIALDHGPTASARSVRVDTRLRAQPVLVHGDSTRLKQVLDNLLDNAIKFSPPGAEVIVEIDRRDERATMAVIDHGEGIESDLLPHLFEPFSQADRSLDRRRGGLGLGLALVQALARLHGGDVSVTSDGPGRGATFTVQLPCLPVPDEAVKEPDVLASPPSTCRVLIAEDNRDAAESLRLLLELAGYEVALAHSGPDALDEARRFRPRVVLCDIGLPGFDGYEVARRLRQDEALASARLIAITGYGSEDDRKLAAAAGFDRHLRKPVEPAVLLAEFAAIGRV